MERDPRSADRRGVLDALADDACRETISRLETLDGSVTTVDGLAADVRVEAATTTLPSARRLHHVTLPKLAAAGLVAYDPSTRTVRYEGRERVRRVLDAAGGKR